MDSFRDAPRAGRDTPRDTFPSFPDRRRLDIERAAEHRDVLLAAPAGRSPGARSPRASRFAPNRVARFETFRVDGRRRS
jgi:hypothetical protein